MSVLHTEFLIHTFHMAVTQLEHIPVAQCIPVIQWKHTELAAGTNVTLRGGTCGNYHIPQ